MTTVGLSLLMALMEDMGAAGASTALAIRFLEDAALPPPTWAAGTWAATTGLETCCCLLTRWAGATRAWGTTEEEPTTVRDCACMEERFMRAMVDYRMTFYEFFWFFWLGSSICTRFLARMHPKL
jgi:hypothetical protein